MALSAVDNSAVFAGANANQTKSKAAALDPNAFLKLLVAELQNQDPTKPLDSTELVSQLSALSQVEQAATTNSKLAAILDTLSVGQASALLGRTATSADGTVSGKIQAVRVTDDGPLAELAGGKELPLSSGVTIRS